jgi:nicotinate-nucleotide adenylyltransferase
MKRFIDMSNELKRVGLLGGTFDPVHNGHLALANKTAQLFDLKKVLFIPASQSPHKHESQPTSSHHRVAMLELALEQKTTFSIDMQEIQKGGLSYTIETLSCLKEQHTDWELFLILGADAFLSMDTWKNSFDILKICHVLVSTRPGIKLNNSVKLSQALGIKSISLENNDFKLPITLSTAGGKTLRLYQIPTQDVSSRIIRYKIQAGKEIKNLLPPAVDHYIMQNRLYRTELPPIMV